MEEQNISHMKVFIKDLHHNPYRDMKNYPINEEKVAALITSIEDTGFWDNILARNHNGKIQIAYGHHRLMALKKVYRGELANTYVNIPVKDLSDALMIKIMANENMEDWRTTPAVIDETVRVAKEFLTDNPDEAKKYRRDTSQPVGVDAITKFLNWPQSTIQYSLERLKLSQEKKIDLDAINQLPTEGAARTFVKVFKEQNIPVRDQDKYVRERQKEDDYSETGLRNSIIVDRFEKVKKKPEHDPRKEEAVMNIEIYSAGLRNDIQELTNKLRKFLNLKEDLGEYKAGAQTRLLENSIDSLLSICNQIKNYKYEEKRANHTGANTERLIRG